MFNSNWEFYNLVTEAGFDPLTEDPRWGWHPWSMFGHMDAQLERVDAGQWLERQAQLISVALSVKGVLV